MRMNNMFNKQLFIFTHQLGCPQFDSMYKASIKSQWTSYNSQEEIQEKQLKYLIDFVYNNVPYYHKLFNNLKLEPSDIGSVTDLEKLPILTKTIIRNNWEDFKPVNLNHMKYYTNSTGGTSGTPFKYRLLKKDRFFSGAMLYRGWGYAGYELGDKMAFLAGSSLDVGPKPFFIKKVHEISRNIRKMSSFDMSRNDMKQYADTINSFKPLFLRGYASSINFFANFLNENNIAVSSPQAIYTTAEKLLPHMRKNIENVFSCEVYDGYGLNDGGISAYECPEHNGLHIDTERSIMEIVDESGSQIEDGVGKILATSLHNFAMPFIRYDTGDMGHIIDDECGCGRDSKLLEEVIGRQQEMLITPEGKNIHGEFFTHIFWETHGIKEFQVVQEHLNKLTIKIIPEADFDEKNLNTIKWYINKKSTEWNVDFKIVNEIERTKAGKYKFIISELDK
jgi:phenylacetate-CoA ligase